MEQLEEDRYQFAIQAGKDAEANRRLDERARRAGTRSIPAAGKRRLTDGEPLHRPGHHKGDDKDR